MSANSKQSKYSFVSEPSEDRSEYVTNRLRHFNQTRKSSLWSNFSQSSVPLEIYAFDNNGLIVGGLIGVTNEIPEWLNVSVVWVAEEQRGQGIGQHMMSLAEEEAKRRSCRYARLATSDYQAHGFYERIG